jgi:truncated hemoglobin YjbI
MEQTIPTLYECAGGEETLGPPKYTREDKGSHAIMIAHHIGKMLDEPKRQRWIQLLLATTNLCPVGAGAKQAALTDHE